MVEITNDWLTKRTQFIDQLNDTINEIDQQSLNLQGQEFLEQYDQWLESLRTIESDMNKLNAQALDQMKNTSQSSKQTELYLLKKLLQVLSDNKKHLKKIQQRIYQKKYRLQPENLDKYHSQSAVSKKINQRTKDWNANHKSQQRFNIEHSRSSLMFIKIKKSNQAVLNDSRVQLQYYADLLELKRRVNEQLIHLKKQQQRHEIFSLKTFEPLGNPTLLDVANVKNGQSLIQEYSTLRNAGFLWASPSPNQLTSSLVKIISAFPDQYIEVLQTDQKLIDGLIEQLELQGLTKQQLAKQKSFANKQSKKTIQKLNIKDTLRDNNRQENKSTEKVKLSNNNSQEPRHSYSFTLQPSVREKMNKIARQQGYQSTSRFLNDLFRKM